MTARRVLHVLSGLRVGGKERIALDLATRGRSLGLDHGLLLFDEPYSGDARDFDPGEIPVRFLPRGPGLDLRFAWKLARVFRELNLDGVHAHNDTAIFYSALARMLLLGRRPRLVGTFHTRPGHDTPNARRLTHWATRRADGITAVSPDLARRLQAEGWAARCDTVWNGVDLETYTPHGSRGDWRRRLDIPDAAELVAHIGRFDPVKRQVDLIDSVRRLEGRTRRPISLVLVGEGPTLKDARAAAHDLPRAHFVPRVVDVAAFLREVDLFVLCSDQEAAPRVLLEAMATARPIVATDVGGVREMLTGEDGVASGLLVPANHPGALAEAIGEILASPQVGARLGAQARSRVGAFSADEEWRRYAELFAQDP